MASVTTPPSPAATTTTTTSTTPTITTSTTSSSTTTTSSSSPTTTTTDARTSNPSAPTSNGSSSETSALSTTPGSSSATSTLQAPVTSVGETTSLETSNGVVYTQTLSITTVITPTAPANRASSGSGANIGAIVGGAVGGVAVLIILALLIFFCLRKRRKDEFDGNFDPVHVNSGKGGLGGGTLPSIDLGEEEHMMGDGGRARGADEDDGMGGRLGAGVGGGGIIMPYTFKPSTPVGGQQYQSQELPQMQQMGNIGVAAGGVGPSMYGNEKRAMRQHPQTPNSNNLYPTSSPPHSRLGSPSIGSNSTHAPSPYLNPNSISSEPYTPGAMSDGSSSVGGGAYYPQQQQHLQAMGAMGASRGPSALSSSSGNSGGRNAKEMEAMGRVVVNPDGQQGQYGPQQQHGQFQSYLQNGPGPYSQPQQQQYHHHPSSSQTSQPLQDQQTSSARPGTAVVVHEDGGRVVLHKNAEEGEGEVLNPEIPPTYDSLPVDVRRDG